MIRKALNNTAFGTIQSLHYDFYTNRSSLFVFRFCWKLLSVIIHNVRNIFTLEKIGISSSIS